MAASKLDAITVPMDVRYRTSDFRRLIPRVEPKVTVTMDKIRDNEIVETLRTLEPEFGNITYMTVGSVDRSIPDFGIPFEEVLRMDLSLADELNAAKASQKAEDDTLIVFTGGTTGVPKATLISHQHLISACIVEDEVIKAHLFARGVTGRVKNLAALPPSHVGGTIELISTGLVGGHELILMDHWSPYPVLGVTEREKLPFIGGVPTMYAILLSLPDLDKYDLSSLKLAVLSGEKVSLELLTKIREKICENVIIGYGSTEAGPEVTFTELSDDLNRLAEGYVGKPLHGVELKVVDENENLLPPSKIGEILVKGALTSKGYFRQPEETQKSFTSDGFHRTGDLGYLTEDKGLYIVGRKKHIIRVGSYTVLPTEIEEVVLKNPSVAMAAAIGVPHKIYGEVVWLFVAPQPGSTISEEEIIKICKRELADFKVPKKVVITMSLPTTRIGKVDRIELRNEVMKSIKEPLS